MPATAAWLASAEALLNRGIDASAQAAAVARRLDGTSLQVDVDGVASIRANVLGGRLALLADAGGGTVPDAALSGSVPALLRLLRDGNRRPGTAAVQIRGDAQIADGYRELLTLARPDPEEELSRWVGDFAARRMSRFARAALELARRTRRTLGDNIAEYLQEEGRDLVNKTELEEFLRAVDGVRETADRIEARLARLEQHPPGAA
jgi:ubiquinone biosynthesis accessory factor UbiJ